MNLEAQLTLQKIFWGKKLTLNLNAIKKRLEKAKYKTSGSLELSELWAHSEEDLTQLVKKVELLKASEANYKKEIKALKRDIVHLQWELNRRS